MQHLEGSGTPVLYIERTVVRGYVNSFQLTSRVKYKLSLKFP